MESTTFDWTVKNVSLGFLQPNKRIYSPTFSAYFLNTEWVFFLKFSTNDGSLSIFLQRIYDCGPKVVNVKVKNLKILKMVDITVKVENNIFNHFFQKGDFLRVHTVTYHNEDIIKCAFQPPSDWLRFSCSLYSDIDVLCDADILHLSRDMNTLLKSSEFHDMLLCFPTEEIPLHQAVFLSRVSGLKIQYKRKYQSDSLQIPVREISSNAVEKVLQFLYTASIDGVSGSDFVPLLKEAAEKLGVVNIEKKLASPPADWKAETTMKCKRKLFRLFLNRKKKECEYTRTFSLHNIDWNFKSIFLNETTEESVSVQINPISKIEKVLKVRLVVSLLSNCDTELASKVAYWSLDDTRKKPLELGLKFDKGEGWSSKISLMKSFVFSMKIIYGDFVSTSVPKYERPECHLSNMVILSGDLLKLFESNLWTDTVIKVPDGELKVHKAILCARSPVFERIFREDIVADTSVAEIIVTDIGLKIMTKLLKFIYSAQVIMGDFNEAVDLAYAADKYQMSSLKDGCLRHLCQNIKKSIAIEMYILLDLFGSEELKEHVKSFILENTHFRDDRDKLRRFKSSRPDLFEEIFQEKNYLPFQII